MGRVSPGAPGNFGSGGSGGSGDGSLLDGVTPSIKATIKSYTNANPLTVRLSDTNGDYVSAGAGTQYTEDAPAAADPIGSVLITRRRDTLTAAEVSTDGDNIALNATNKGQLHVKLADTVTVDGSGVTQPVSGTVTANAGTNLNTSALALESGGNLATIASAVSTIAGTPPATMIGISAVALRKDQLSSSLAPADGSNGKYVIIRTNAKGATWTSPADSVGNPVTFPVDNSTYTPGTSSVVMAGFEYNDTSPSALTEGKAGAARVSANRNQYMQIRDAAGNERGVNINASNQMTVSVDNTVIATAGHGKSLKVKTGSASATFTIVAAVTSKKLKVYSLSLMTASTTAVTVTFKDGASGTAIATYILQAISGTNFGITENLAVPSSLFETTAGNLLEMSFSAAQTVTYNLRYWDDDTT